VSGRLITIHIGMPTMAEKITAQSGMFSQNQVPMPVHLLPLADRPSPVVHA
jgi:hypothetical protein